jgi:carbon-monoxide dehydrogenase large subunit
MTTSSIGRRVKRHDVTAKATGSTRYAVDLAVPSMLYGLLVRSQVPHGRIRSIDTEAARAVPGVKAVLTGRDVPGVRYGPFVHDQTVLAIDMVRFVGEPIAAIAATSVDAARRAAELIQAHIEPLPAVFDPEAALQEDAPRLHQALGDYVAEPEPIIRHGNVGCFTRIGRGDIEKGFAEADVILEGRYTTQAIHQCSLEPHAVVADIDPSGQVTVWTCAQEPFKVRAILGEILDLPLTRVRVIAPPLGGGFGGKEEILAEPIAVLLAQAARRPVKIVFSREEEFDGGFPRPPVIVEMKTGAKADGTLTARYARLIYDSGAYMQHGIGEMGFGAWTVCGPYTTPNLLVEAYCVYTNKVHFGCFRGYGCIQPAFASESQLDEVAAALDLDPVAIRLKNAVEPGDQDITGQVMTSVGLKQTILEAAQRAGWDAERAHRSAGRGMGIACAYKGIGGISSSAVVKVNQDGTATILSGTADMGTGGDTALLQIAAAELGLPYEAVNIVIADTDGTPYDFGSVATRVTHDVGNAVRRAAHDARQQMLALASQRLGIAESELVLGDAVIRSRQEPGRQISIREIAAASHFTQSGPIIGRGSYLAEEDVTLDPEIMEGFPLGPVPTHGFATHIAEVDVDRETGLVRVARVVAAHDVGRAINPTGIEGQIEGGVGMGIGGALTEEMQFREGAVANPNLADYRLLTVLEMPPVESVIVEDPDRSGPFGAKGLGEHTVLPTAPAIANAIYNATGARVRDLPISAERLYLCLQEQCRVGHAHQD